MWESGDRAGEGMMLLSDKTWVCVGKKILTLENIQ